MYGAAAIFGASRHIRIEVADVQAVMPFGDTKQVKILATAADTITKAAVTKALKSTRYKVTGFTAGQTKKGTKGS